MTDAADTFVETPEYRRFCEFCDACRSYHYIGLCYGLPGVGKTLSAQHYTRWDRRPAVSARRGPYTYDQVKLVELRDSDSVYFTPPVANTPSIIDRGISDLRKTLHEYRRESIHREHREHVEEARSDVLSFEQEEKQRANFCYVISDECQRRWRHFHELNSRYLSLLYEVKDPTSLIIIDEADRLKIASLEHVRDMFDRDNIGMVLIGMPGIEKRLARYPQLYSRVGFVHEFRPLPAEEIRGLLKQRWQPPGITLPSGGLTDEEGIAAILRVARGNFRLLHRLLSQIARVLEINNLDRVTVPVVEAARDSLVIGAE